MAKHRRSSTKSLNAGHVVLVLGLCTFGCGAGMGYVWHRNRNEQLSRQIRHTTARLEQLRTETLVLDRQLEELRSPRAIEAAILRWKLGLVMPQPEQILRISEAPSAKALAAPHWLRMAAQNP